LERLCVKVSNVFKVAGFGEKSLTILLHMINCYNFMPDVFKKIRVIIISGAIASENVF